MGSPDRGRMCERGLHKIYCSDAAFPASRGCRRERHSATFHGFAKCAMRAANRVEVPRTTATERDSGLATAALRLLKVEP
jgi:hypothetical protein